jgi:hypothetical protein
MEAMRQAGYKITRNSHKICFRLTKNPLIMEQVGLSRKRMQEKSDITKEWCLNVYKDIALKGKDTDRIQALNSICKIQGFNAPSESKVSVTNSIPSTENLTDHYDTNERTALALQ